MVITLIVGLPGSGKTHLANILKAQGAISVDDITSWDQLPDQAEKLVVTDVNFCDETILETAKTKLHEKYPTVEIETIYFENDADQARKNVVYRDDGRNVEGTICRFEKIYNPPEASHPIWPHDG